MPPTCLRCKSPLEPSFRACPHCGEPVTDFMRRYTGELLDNKYQIVERLGAGGMGEVYKAVHNLLGSTRVIKVVHPQISSNTDALDRFLREGRAATKVQHQNVATLHDFAALPDGSHYMVWEYIDGENLAQRLRVRGTLPPKQAVRLTIQALHGLDAIHRAGIVHRDISPENLMVTKDEVVKVIDLGVAKVDDPEQVSSTRTGIFVGKLRYASPEQLGFIPEGEKIDARTDVYSIGMVLYELLTGRPPYEAKSPHEYFLIHSSEPRTGTIELSPTMPGGPALAAVLRKALARNRNERYATARDFAAELEAIERTLPDPSAMPTMAVPLDDATMAVDLHRTTVRTDAPVAATVANMPAGPTLRTPMPMPVAPPPPPPASAAPPVRMAKGINPLWVVAAALLFFAFLGVAVVLLWPRVSSRDPILRTQQQQQPPQTSTATTSTSAPSRTTTATSTQQPQVAEASVTVTTEPEAPVVTETTDTAATIAPPNTTTTAGRTNITPPPPKSREKVVKVTPPTDTQREANTEEKEPSRPAIVTSGSVPTYVDGGDDSDANERAMESLSRNVRGVKTVALRAGGMQVELTRALREYFPEMEFAAYADVVIRFDGTFARMGRGRKRRGANATVEKNGRVVFRYVMPDEVYRVGMTPAEAFARVYADAAAE